MVLVRARRYDDLDRQRLSDILALDRDLVKARAVRCALVGGAE
jgi:hypothetical protein